MERRNRAATYAQQLQQRDLFPTALVLPLLQAYYSTLTTGSSSCIARTLWCVSVINVVPPAGWVSRVLQQLQLGFCSLDAVDCMLVVSALARLRYLPGASWMKEFWLVILPFFPPQQQQHQQQQQGQTGDSSTSTSINNTISTISSSSSSGSKARQFLTQSQLVTVASSVYELTLLARPGAVGAWSGQKPPTVWLEALAAASRGDWEQ
jgi:hypothetical protein